MDNLQEAKNYLIFNGEESPARMQFLTRLAQAHALVALVERLDKLTIKNNDGSHSLDVEITGSITPNKW